MQTNTQLRRQPKKNGARNSFRPRDRSRRQPQPRGMQWTVTTQMQRQSTISPPPQKTTTPAYSGTRNLGTAAGVNGLLSKFFAASACRQTVINSNNPPTSNDSYSAGYFLKLRSAS